MCIDESMQSMPGMDVKDADFKLLKYKPEWEMLAREWGFQTLERKPRASAAE